MEFVILFFIFSFFSVLSKKGTGGNSFFLILYQIAANHVIFVAFVGYGVGIPYREKQHLLELSVFINIHDAQIIDNFVLTINFFRNDERIDNFALSIDATTLNS